LERWHRTVRDQFLSELDDTRIQDLSDLNARLWAWVEAIYHRRTHSSLQGQTPLQRYQQDLPRIRSLGNRAERLDELFYHRIERKVRKDGTVSYQGQRFEVPYELAGQSVQLVVDPHAEQVISVENNQGETLGQATPLDVLANSHRRRRQPATPAAGRQTKSPGPNLVEMAYRQYHAIDDTPKTGPVKPDPTTPTANEK
jgi:hypothetical protein